MPQPSPRPAPAEPHAVGPYRIVRPLGSGAMGAVYLATGADGLAVALKLLRLPTDATAAADAGARFAAEATAARRLGQHADIAGVLDAGHDGAQAWIAMELAPGVTLQRYTQPARLLPEALALRIAERIARALAHAHAHGVVHRDIKPANVIVELASQSLKVTDFGLAHSADAERTRTGLVLATPAYAAPEQLAGAPASAAADLYALGVTLFELLTGRLPHVAASLGELLRLVAATPAPPLATLRPDLPPALDRLLQSLLAKRAADRPASAALLADRLHVLRTAIDSTA